MLLSRNIALAAGALVLAVPVLSSCGFNAATDRVNTISAGVSNHDKTVDVLNAVIVASRPDSGTFVAALSNNSTTDAVSLTDVTGAGGTTVTADSFEPVEVRAKGVVNLAVDGGVRLTGSFDAGNFVSVTVGFDNGEAVVMEIPVVLACGQYDGLDNAPTAAPVDGTTPASTDEYSCDEPSTGGEE